VSASTATEYQSPEQMLEAEKQKPPSNVGNKVFGAAVLRKDDLSLVVAGTNHEAFSPLWHGEVYTIKLFYELQGHPDPSECIFLSTHE